MNKPLRHSFRCNSWSQTEGFLVYLRSQGCFYHEGTGSDANPYWYGSTLTYHRFDEVMDYLIKNRSIKKARLTEIADECAENYLSPIVRLTGFSLQRKAAKMS